MTDAAAVTGAAQTERPPVFDPDPELIDHLEGNERERGAYRRRAAGLRAEAAAGRDLRA